MLRPHRGICRICPVIVTLGTSPRAFNVNSSQVELAGCGERSELHQSFGSSSERCGALRLTAFYELQAWPALRTLQHGDAVGDLWVVAVVGGVVGQGVPAFVVL